MTQSRSDFQWYWEHVDDSKGVQVKTGPGALHTIVINQMPGEVASFALFNGIGAAGAVIGVVVTDFDQPRTLIYDLEFTVGLFVLPTQGVDLTVTYI